MNFKIFALLAVIVAMIAAAGCTGLSAGSVSSPGIPQQITQISSSNSRLMAEDKAGWAGSSVPAAMPGPDSRTDCR